MKLKFRILPIPSESVHRKKINRSNIPLVRKSDAPYLWFLWDSNELEYYLRELSDTTYLLKKL